MTGAAQPRSATLCLLVIMIAGYGCSVQGIVGAHAESMPDATTSVEASGGTTAGSNGSGGSMDSGAPIEEQGTDTGQLDASMGTGGESDSGDSAVDGAIDADDDGGAELVSCDGSVCTD